MSTPKIVTCPSEYGPPTNVDRAGIQHSLYGECLCSRYGEAPCGYRRRDTDIELS